MVTKSTVVRLDKICKSFGGLQVLTNVDLEVDEREIVGLIGPNGAGKSTLFNVITSFYKPDSGEICLLGKKTTGFPPPQNMPHGYREDLSARKVIPQNDTA